MVQVYSPSGQLRHWVSVPSQVWYTSLHLASFDIGCLNPHTYDTLLLTLWPALTLGVCTLTCMVHFYSPSGQLRHWVSVPSQVWYTSTHHLASFDIVCLYPHRYGTLLLTIWPASTLGVCTLTGMVHFYSPSGQL